MAEGEGGELRKVVLCELGGDEGERSRCLCESHSCDIRVDACLGCSFHGGCWCCHDGTGDMAIAWLVRQFAGLISGLVRLCASATHKRS